MGKHPDLRGIETLLKTGEDFMLSEVQYKSRTGSPLPKDTNYIKHRSALAKLCRNYGYVIEVQPKIINIRKDNNIA